MNKIITTVIGLFLLSFAQAQTKQEFGFVAKAGIYGLPSKKSAEPFYGNNGANNIDFNAGSSSCFGVWYALPLSKHFRISSELLYRYQTLTQTVQYEAPGLFSTQQQMHLFINSLSLPVKLHYTIKEGGKWSFALGGGLSQTFSARSITKIETANIPLNVFRQVYKNNYANEYMDIKMRFGLNAAIFYQLAPETYIGLEYFHEASDPVFQFNPYLFVDPLIDIVFNYPPFEPSTINSFTVVIRHNILHKQKD